MKASLCGNKVSTVLLLYNAFLSQKETHLRLLLVTYQPSIRESQNAGKMAILGGYPSPGEAELLRLHNKNIRGLCFLGFGFFPPPLNSQIVPSFFFGLLPQFLAFLLGNA